MESWRALTIPITEDSSEPNGSVVIVTSDPSPRTLRSSTIETIVIAASKAKHPYSWSKRTASSQSFPLQSSNCRTLTTFQTERSLSSALSEVIESSISSENILSFLRSLSILMSELKSLLVCIKFRFIRVMTSLFLSHTSYRHLLLQILKMGNLCIDTSKIQNRVTYVLAFTI